ncbi:MAG: carbohydrate ABC transporter permease [Chlorobi bacterium]|nr:carbohydrate ABC transporter permease [Chlorobiota bacterium]
MKGKFLPLLVQGVLLLGAVAMVLPLAWMIVVSLHEYPERYRSIVQLVSAPWTISNYHETLSSDQFGLFFFNSILVASVVTIGNVIFSFGVAYGLVRMPLRGKTLVWITIIGMLAVPPHVLMIPLYRMMVELGWINTYAALIVPWMVTPFGIFLMHQYLLSIPVELEESARLDGASELAVIFRIVAPLARPAMIVLAVYTFLANWNSFLFPFLLTNDESHRTLPVALAFYLGKQSVDWGHLMAGASIAAMPVVILFVLFQRTIVTALTAGALKG